MLRAVLCAGEQSPVKAGPVLTPHAGEFERIAPGLRAAASSRIEAARQAAAKLGVKLHAPNQYLRAAPREASDLFHPAAAG